MYSLSLFSTLFCFWFSLFSVNQRLRPADASHRVTITDDDQVLDYNRLTTLSVTHTRGGD